MTTTEQPAVEPATEASLPCAVCSGPIAPVHPSMPNQPHGAQVFVSYGHDGATCFDPLDPTGGTYLVIHVCAACVHHMAKHGRVLHAEDGQRTTWAHSRHDHDEPDA